jgi:thiol-disulfide isomerase/thioredoxin
MRFATTAVVAAAIACASSPRATRSDVATTLPVLTLPLLAGGTWSSERAHGSVLVIDVWASWCKPCSKGFPSLEALARVPGVAVVAISIDEDPAAIRAFLADFPLAVPVAQDATRMLMGEPLHIARLPSVVIVDADGMVRHRFEQLNESDYAEIERLVNELARRR